MIKDSRLMRDGSYISVVSKYFMPLIPHTIIHTGNSIEHQQQVKVIKHKERLL